jgi:DNA-binding CsgD family transcriptional regulator
VIGQISRRLNGHKHGRLSRLTEAGWGSNREIGQQLYLSPRTVSSHLYRMFPKLEISTRGQLAALLG